MTTKQEWSGQRSLAFSQWIRRECPDSSEGLCVGNQDWIFWNWRTRTLLLLEEKTHKAEIAKWFHKFIVEVMDPALKEYCAKNDITYLGYLSIQFENTSPDDGKIWIDGKEVSAGALKRRIHARFGRAQITPLFKAPTSSIQRAIDLTQEIFGPATINPPDLPSKVPPVTGRRRYPIPLPSPEQQAETCKQYATARTRKNVLTFPP